MYMSIVFMSQGIPIHQVWSTITNTMIYDLAGHAEYYNSHAAILETLIRKSAALFLILVDLSKAVGNIKKELYYWTSFLEIQSSKIPSHIVIVGSHVDILSSDPQQLKEKCDLVEEIAQHTIRTEQFAGFVPLDCRQLSRDHVQPLMNILEKVVIPWLLPKRMRKCLSPATCCIAFSPTRSARQQ